MREAQETGSQRYRGQYEELGRFGSGYGLLESACECGIEPPDSINHRTSKLCN